MLHSRFALHASIQWAVQEYVIKKRGESNVLLRRPHIALLADWSLGFEDWGLEFGVKGLGFGVWDLGFGVLYLRSRGLGLRLRFGVSGWG